MWTPQYKLSPRRYVCVYILNQQAVGKWRDAMKNATKWKVLEAKVYCRRRRRIYIYIRDEDVQLDDPFFIPSWMTEIIAGLNKWKHGIYNHMCGKPAGWSLLVSSMVTKKKIDLLLLAVAVCDGSWRETFLCTYMYAIIIIQWQCGTIIIIISSWLRLPDNVVLIYCVWFECYWTLDSKVWRGNVKFRQDLVS